MPRGTWSALVALGLVLATVSGCGAGPPAVTSAGDASASPSWSLGFVEPDDVSPSPMPDPQPDPDGVPQPDPTPVRIASCHPRRSASTSYVAPSPEVRARVDAAWARIERWSADHAPKVRRSLNPPASPAEIAKAQATMGHRMPPELVASLLRHDGVDGAGASFEFPVLYEPLGTAGIATDWVTLCQVAEESGSDSHWWDGGYTPVADDHGDGVLYQDQRTRRGTHVGELMYEDGAHLDSWPTSLTVFLEGIAQALETGRPYRIGGLAVRARVTPEGGLDWDF